MADRPLLLIVSDPPRRDDPDEVQADKARAAAESLVDLLRARGERVTLVPSPVAGTGGAA